MAVRENPPLPRYRSTEPYGDKSESKFALSTAGSIGSLTAPELKQFKQLLLQDNHVIRITSSLFGGETYVMIAHDPEMKTSDINKLAKEVVSGKWKVLREMHRR